MKKNTMDFVGHISHELRYPLQACSAISGVIDLKAQEYEKSLNERKESSNSLRNSTLRGTQIIEMFKKLSEQYLCILNLRTVVYKNFAASTTYSIFHTIQSKISAYPN